MDSTSAALICVVCVLCATFAWAFHFYFTRPGPTPPPAIEETRLTSLESANKDLAKQMDSLKTAMNMRALR